MSAQDGSSIFLTPPMTQRSGTGPETAPATAADRPGRVARELLRLLYEGAGAEAFAKLQAEVERSPPDAPDRPGLLEAVRQAAAVHDRLQRWQQRESGMLAVIESARDLSGRLNLDELLRAVASRARRLLGSHVAWLSTYDAEPAGFHVVASDGALSVRTGRMVTGIGFGIAGVVMRTGLPFATPDYLHDQRFAHDPALDETFRDEGIAAVVGVPLLWNDDVIGLLFVADRFHRVHTAQEVSILGSLATHAAVAIKNARAFEQARAARDHAEVARLELERHARRVQAASEAHERMTSLLAAGASLGTLCQTIAQLLDGSLLVLDEAGDVVGRGRGATASPAAEGYAPIGEHSGAIAQALRHSRQLGRSVIAYEAGGEICRINAVIGGDDMLGAVVLFRQVELDEVSVRTFERCASVIGIVLLSRTRLEELRTRDQAALLRDLISPRQENAALLGERAERFGIDLAQPSTLLLLETDGPDAGHAARRLRATGVVAPPLVCDDVDGVLVLLCPTTHAVDVQRSLDELARVQFRAGHRGVVSRPAASPLELPALHTMLRRALPVLRRIGVTGRIVAQNELALYSTLFETHDQASLTAFLEATIGPLTQHDQRRGTELAKTLLGYFDANQNAKKAAQRLGVHVNTLRQRLATIEDLTGYLGSASRALELHVALRLWSLAGGGEAGSPPRDESGH